nr:vanadium-dependent haloperoxidase [Micromonospora sp. DSM 115978]
MTSQTAGRRRGSGIVGRVALVATVAVGLATPVTAAASAAGPNVVLVWDMHAQQAIWDVAGQQPNVMARSYAMVNGAVYDAVNAIAGRPYQPYLTAPRTTGAESVDAAVATAAHRVLRSLFPDQRDRLIAQYEEALAGIPDGRSKRAGIAIGERTSAAMINARRGDGAFGDQQWRVGTEPGQWIPTPPTFGSDGAWVGHVRPFLIPDASRFPTPGPPALGSRAYAREVAEVRALGSATSTVRTADQTEAARWWHDRRSTTWEIRRQLATTQRLSTLQTARMLAMVDITGADAQIACFHEKERWSFWRPVSAIQLAGTDGNPATTPDPDWTPLLVTPPFPEYPSGHTCGTGSRMSILTFYFGRDEVPFSAYSVDTDTRRHFTGFSDALAEVTEARIWGGVHFRAAGFDGADLGRRVADYVSRHHFRPSPR